MMKAEVTDVSSQIILAATIQTKTRNINNLQWNLDQVRTTGSKICIDFHYKNIKRKIRTARKS